MKTRAYPYPDPEPLRLANDNAGQAWLRGYSDAFHKRDLNEPEQYRLEYLRGYVSGLKALRS